MTKSKTSVETETVSAEAVTETVSVTGEHWAVGDGQRSVCDATKMTSQMTGVTVMNQRSGVGNGGVVDRLHWDQRSVGVVVGDSSWGVQQGWHS